MFTQQFRSIVAAVLLVSITTSYMPLGLAHAAADTVGHQTTRKTISATESREFKAISTITGKAISPGMIQTDTFEKREIAMLAPEQQKALADIFGATPVTSETVSLCGGTTTTYYDKNGNVIGSYHKTTGTQYDILGTYYDKDGNLIAREGTELSPDEQEALKDIFGAIPTKSLISESWITTTNPPGESSYSRRISYYDADGNYIGSKVIFDSSTGVHTETYFDKDGKKIDTTANQVIKPPVRPPDSETDIKAWTQYYKNYVAYINKLDNAGARAQAWDRLGNDILKLSKEHPELISAGAINAIMSTLTNELKERYNSGNYKFDISGAQGKIVSAALNLVKSDAFNKMDDAAQVSIGRNFMALGIELTWRSANNRTNSALYPKIAEFYKTLLENGSVTVKAQAFTQLMSLWRTGKWGSAEGNRDVVNNILRQALDIEGGIRGLVNQWLAGLDKSSLEADSRGQIAHALAQTVWNHKALTNASGAKISNARLTAIVQKITSFVKGINDGSIGVSAYIRSGLLHSIGNALMVLIGENKGNAAETRMLFNAYISMAHASLLLSADKGGSINLQSTAINLLTNLKAAAKAKGLDDFAQECENVLLDKNFDIAGYLAKALTEMNTTKNADYAAFVARAMANLETINLAHNSGNVDAKQIKETIAAIKAWLADPDHLKDMRVRGWQKELYNALAALVKKACEKSSALAKDKDMQDNVVAIFGTIADLKDSIVKELASKDLDSLVNSLKANGFKDFAYRLEMLSCPDSQSLMAKAWNYYDAKDYAAAKIFAGECISRYSEEALKQQESLKDFAPKGQESKYWALNDVGTAHFVLGEMYKAQNNTAKAKEEYNTVITKFGFAQCYDTKGFYWKVAEAAMQAKKAL
ncbi:MAG: hypothetical protein WC547_01325 [Candidatus Omnitrophota bacterium]